MSSRFQWWSRWRDRINVDTCWLCCWWWWHYRRWCIQPKRRRTRNVTITGWRHSKTGIVIRCQSGGFQDLINAMASDGSTLGTDIWTDNPSIVEKETHVSRIGDSEEKIRFWSWYHGACWEVFEVAEKQWWWYGMPEQEICDVVFLDWCLGKCPVSWHQESDVSLNKVCRGHVNQHYKGEIVGCSHLLNGLEDVWWGTVCGIRERWNQQKQYKECQDHMISSHVWFVVCQCHVRLRLFEEYLMMLLSWVICNNASICDALCWMKVSLNMQYWCSNNLASHLLRVYSR